MLPCFFFGGGCIRVKQVRFGKLAFLQQNGALFGPKKCDFRPFRATLSMKNVWSVLFLSLRGGGGGGRCLALWLTQVVTTLFRFVSPLPNTSTPSSPENAIRGPQKPSPGKCRKIPGNSGFPIKCYRDAKKKADPRNSGKFILGIPNWHFGMILLGG